MQPRDPFSQDFSSKRAAEIVGITYRQLDYWTRTNLVVPVIGLTTGSGSRRRYDYRNLLELKAIKALLEAGIRLEKVWDVFSCLSEHLDEDVTQVCLVISGTRSVAVMHEGEIFDLIRNGQGVLEILPLAAVKDELDSKITELYPEGPATTEQGTSMVEERWANLVQVAYHEAGHAVAFRVLGMPVALLTIKPNGVRQSLGNVRARPPRHKLKYRLLAGLAGPLAQLKYCGASDGSESDLAQVTNLLHSLNSGLRPVEMTDVDRLWAECREVMAQSGVWEWVEAVAEAALTYEILNGDQIDALDPSRKSDDTLEQEAAPSEHLTYPDLAGVDRAGEDLFAEDFAKHNLTGAKLNGTNLTGAKLNGAYLFGADLTGANLTRAVLTEANLEWSTLRGVSLRRASLRRADLRRANLGEANLQKADLREANLCGANLKGALFEATRLSCAIADTNTVWPDGFDPEDAGVFLAGVFLVHQTNQTHYSQSLRSEEGSSPTLTDATDGRYVGLVIDPATFERVARCAAREFGVEFKDLSGETAIEDLVPIQERHPTDSWLVPFLLHMALEDEFEIDFDEGELGRILENAPGGGYTLASWVWAVQRGLNNELCVAQLANYCPSCKKKIHQWMRKGQQLRSTRQCHSCGHQFKRYLGGA